MKKSFATIVSILLLLFLLPITCYAWVPDYWYSCDIDYTKIPENAVYVDLLLPISEDNEDYVDFNESNGKKFSIQNDSEIVKYNKDGYMSYTFHIKNIDSYIKPIKNENKYARVEFFKNEEALPTSDTYYNFCHKYKTAKMAYLDKNGNIISVTNQIRITQFDLFNRSPQTNINLIGSELSIEFSYGPPFFILFFLFWFLCALVIITPIIVFIVNAIRKRKSNNL